ncbi:MAG TPA: SUMF1/EgtB/PvdO family nonheme iron enzyme [Motiliproteus sp.]
MAACSGSGADSPLQPHNSARLGPLAGSTIVAYRLTDLGIPVEGPFLANTDSTDLDAAGTFQLTLANGGSDSNNDIPDSEWILVLAQGGVDIDANDDGVLDTQPTTNNGTVFGLAQARDWRQGSAGLSALSDIAWQYAKDTVADPRALATRLDLIARWLIATDINNSGTIDYQDLLAFDPLQAAVQSSIDYSSLLPGNAVSYIAAIHTGRAESVKLALLEDAFGTEPWNNPNSAADGVLRSLGIQMVPINIFGTTFRMGCGDEQLDPDCQANEQSEHSVTLTRSYYLSAHEVSFAAWDACVADLGCTTTPSDEGWGRGSRPVINITYNDVMLQFLPWLNAKTGRTFRFPTEAEWEYAARAGTSTVYAWGNELGTGNANCDGCGSAQDGASTSTVGAFSANGFGLYDMQGNVWEMTSSFYHPNYNSNTLLLGAGGYSRVLRGGAWNSLPFYLRSAARYRAGPEASYFNLGFRLALDL